MLSSPKLTLISLPSISAHLKFPIQSPIPIFSQFKISLNPQNHLLCSLTRFASLQLFISIKLSQFRQQTLPLFQVHAHRHQCRDATGAAAARPPSPTPASLNRCTTAVLRPCSQSLSLLARISLLSRIATPSLGSPATADSLLFIAALSQIRRHLQPKIEKELASLLHLSIDLAAAFPLFSTKFQRCPSRTPAIIVAKLRRRRHRMPAARRQNTAPPPLYRRRGSKPPLLSIFSVSNSVTAPSCLLRRCCSLVSPSSFFLDRTI